MRYKIILCYHGSGFSGWQRQANKPTVQGAVEDALLRLYGQKISVTGSGRTDEGVHALGQVAHFDAPDTLPLHKIASALNFYLPKTVRIISCETAPEDFHAIKSAKKKTYIYDMYTCAIEHPLLIDRALRLERPIDTAQMLQAAKLFVGTHDFLAFRCRGSSATTTVRTVYECELKVFKDSEQRKPLATPFFCAPVDTHLRLKISANGFLYKMVRTVVGSLIKVGEGKLTLEDLQTRLSSATEWQKKFTADPCGLYLYSVEYNP